jgi:predicted alpha/beta hydrolase family esterase
MDFKSLAKGLEFLRTSKTGLPQKPPPNMTLVRASRDRIVSFKKEKKYWPKAWLERLHTADSGHFFPEQEILEWTGEQ